MIAPTEKFPVEWPLDGSAAESAAETVSAGTEVDELVAREYPAVWRFLRRLGVPAAQVDDAAQRVFARVLAQRGRVAVGSARAYLMRAAFRSALEEQRANKRWLSRATETDAEALSSGAPTPDQALSQRQELALLDRALRELSPELRAVFTLSELEELTFSEIAVALQLPRGTVASRVRRAKECFTRAVRRLQGMER